MAQLLEQVAFAKQNEIYAYDQKIIQKLEQIFIMDQTENFGLNTTDLLLIFKSFEELNDFFDQKKFRQTVQ